MTFQEKKNRSKALEFSSKLPTLELNCKFVPRVQKRKIIKDSNYRNLILNTNNSQKYFKNIFNEVKKKLLMHPFLRPSM